ncbi:MAG TPA: DUF3574 domain-containing protein [Crinalium sp.]|jgi:hypothetical protein
MQAFITKITQTLVTGAALSMAIAIDSSPVQASLIQENLFFGRNISGSGQVSDEEFETFVDTVITPQFPDGLTIVDAKGQFLDSTHTLVQEPSKLITLYVEETPANQSAIHQIIAAYAQQFHQESILQVTNADDLNVGFGTGENLIDNDPVPELIQADLFFGRNIPGGGQVSERQFQMFVDTVIMPRFPNGITIFNANGQFKDSSGAIIEEPSKVIRLILDDTVENEKALDEIIRAYVQQFHQESVLLAVNEDVAVGFGREEDLIDDDPTPELIQIDLSFDSNISESEQIFEQQFQTFVDNVITPHFPSGLTILNADRTFQNNTGAIVTERSKVVRLLLEDTVENEESIHEIVKAYTQQFNQESVLQVVDEDITVDFNTQPSAKVLKTALIPALMLADGVAHSVESIGPIDRKLSPNF